MEIVDFLPKYPNINPTEYSILNPYSDDNFYRSIVEKKEFSELKLEKVEDFPEERGTLMKHQKIIQRYMSSYTPYKGILLTHFMGCLAPETPVLLYDGRTKRADKVSEGDILIGDDGTPRD